MTYQAHLNFVTGKLTVDIPEAEDIDIASVDGQVVQTYLELEPWGEEEFTFDRATRALATIGWTATEPWQEAWGDTVKTQVSR